MPAVANRNRLLTHALADEVAPALAEGDDASLEPVAAAAAAIGAGAAARLPDPARSAEMPAARQAHESGADGSSSGGGASGRGVADAGGGGGGDTGVGERVGGGGGGGSDTGVGESTAAGGERDAAVGGLAVGPLLAACMPAEAYRGVPANEHSVDVRELEAAAPVLKDK
ncbi:hypothetical protein PLESTB_001203400 [Pleodorina starrii]|uniref:Uncharacterized protein n=1 Tax=Pleodorina starrii TaxID=330485 RepID=A0A9W6BTJ6_9CHLO|nr:hypothetical protein PLESTM_001746200 [Pleodorina starrii]GLC57246.1 hypothetical protein PLESTB_001203400 [Pleodorina starrii]GLC71364.1 hypothetical protein PLESTF_001107500 [Pleodorina starrii]